MSVLKQYNLMRANAKVSAVQLQAFREKHGLYEKGDKVVYAHRTGPKHVLTVQEVSKRFKAVRLMSGRWAGLRVSGELRRALPHEVERCSHHT